MTLVSSVNNIDSDTEFILRGRLFIYILKNRGSRIVPWGTPYFSVSKSEKYFELYEVILLHLAVFF